jgi:TolB-like protein
MHCTIPRICTILASALLALPLPCISQEFGRLDVIVKPFDVAGEADPEYAKTLWQQLTQAIERKSDFKVVVGGSAYYYLKGRVLADEKRRLLTLQLFKSKTDRMLWLGNYDYSRSTVDTMATDVIAELSALSNSDTWD